MSRFHRPLYADPSKNYLLPHSHQTEDTRRRHIPRLLTYTLQRLATQMALAVDTMPSQYHTFVIHFERI